MSVLRYALATGEAITAARVSPRPNPADSWLLHPRRECQGHVDLRILSACLESIWGHRKYRLTEEEARELLGLSGRDFRELLGDRDTRVEDIEDTALGL